MRLINPALINTLLRAPLRERGQLIRRLCDYDLIGALQLEHRQPVCRSLAAEAKRRGLISPEPRRQPQPQPGQTTLPL